MNWVDCIVLTRNCGTGSGGFQPGNSCGSGGGVEDTKSIGSRQTSPSETVARMDALGKHYGGMSDKEFATAATKMLTDGGMPEKDAKDLLRSLQAASKSALNGAMKYRSSAPEMTPKDIEDAVKGGTRGMIVGMALYREITGKSFDEMTETAKEDNTLTWGVSGRANARAAGYLSVIRRETINGVKTMVTRPEITINVASAAVSEVAFRQGGAVGIITKVANFAVKGLGPGNHGVDEGLIYAGMAFSTPGTSDVGKVKDIAYSGDREALSRAVRTGYGRAVLRTAHTVLHELGHFQHWRALSSVAAKETGKKGSALWTETLSRWKRTGVGRSREANSVSRYAGTDSLEFVAETYAGYALGLRFNPEVAARYAALSGPRRQGR